MLEDNPSVTVKITFDDMTHEMRYMIFVAYILCITLIVFINVKMLDVCIRRSVTMYNYRRVLYEQV